MKKCKVMVLLIVVTLLLIGCQKETGKKSPLDPNNPTTVVVWHYYNGNIKNKFDALIAEFNETVGMDMGIVVDAQSQGDVNQLAMAVYESANATIGAPPMPDIFAAYPDNAIRIHDVADLVPLETYFSQEELGMFREEFLEEGRFLADEKLYILPIAKSSENLYVNKTYWEQFAKDNNLQQDELATWEGLLRVAKLYYEKTGKGFFGIDSNANYMLVSAMQLGQEMFVYTSDNSVEFNLSEEIARKMWEQFYIPYIRGYFVKTGRFSSDDAKTGTVLAYTGSTAGASYFPSEVTFSQANVEAIEPLVLPYPYYEEGDAYTMQQGAGMCMTKSNYTHEYAAAQFLRWFTQIEQNTRFAISTGYIPVKKEALDEALMLKVMQEEGIQNPTIEASIRSTVKMIDTYHFYNNKPFKGSYEMRILLETHLVDKVHKDLAQLEASNLEADAREAKVQELISEEAFKRWYQSLFEEAERILES